MPFHSDTPHFVHRMKEANRLMSFAMRRTPEEYFEHIEKPSLETLAEQATHSLTAEYSHEYGVESDATDLFESAIHDIIPPFKVVAHSNDSLTLGQALNIMTNEETVRTYGRVASMSQLGLQMLYTNIEARFTLSEEGNAIIPMQPIRPDRSYGCEAVDMRNGKSEMTPVFKKFVPWAGSLAVHAYFNDHVHRK